MKLISIKYNVVILKVSRSRYKSVIVYILYGVCIQTYVSILCDARRYSPDGACEMCLVGGVVYIVLKCILLSACVGRYIYNNINTYFKLNVLIKYI
jgi:hypothetical protein